MEKVEKNITSNNIGKNVISSSKILELTLEDYHESRKIYDNKDSKTIMSQQKQQILMNTGMDSQNMQNMEIVNMGQEEGNEMFNNEEEMPNNMEMNFEGGDNKLENMKSLTFDFIKERELAG